MLCAQGVKRVGDCSGWSGGSRAVMWCHKLPQQPLQPQQGLDVGAAEDPSPGHRDWTSMAPELFCLILHKVQERRGEEGEGRRIVACAGVCRSWRTQVHQFCHTVCHAPFIQFPSSLSQPGPVVSGGPLPRRAPVQCVVRRKGSLITLYHGDLEHRQFMLAARRKWRPGGWTFVISSHPRCFSERSHGFLGKLKANFWASDFVLWGANKRNSVRSPPLTGIFFSEDVIDGVRQRRIACVLTPPEQAPASGCSLPFPLPRSRSLAGSACEIALPRTVSKTGLAQASSTVPLARSRSTSIRELPRSGSGSHPIAPTTVTPTLPPAGRSPQRIGEILPSCFMPRLGNHSDMSHVRTNEATDEVLDGEAHYQMMLAAVRGKKIARFESLVVGASPEQTVQPTSSTRSNTVVALSSKIPSWDPHQHCWSLDFKGRASMPSLHNFQLLVDGNSGCAPAVLEDLRKDGEVVLQLGKVGKGLYTMDFAFPLTAVQAFAVCISSFSTSVGLDP